MNEGENCRWWEKPLCVWSNLHEKVRYNHLKGKVGLALKKKGKDYDESELCANYPHFSFSFFSNNYMYFASGFCYFSM